MAETKPANGHAKRGQSVAGCNWINWESTFLQKSMPDPIRMFSFLCLLIMSLRYMEANEWDLMLMIRGFYLNPYVLFFFLSACATVYVSYDARGEHPPLRVYDRWVAEWYWWNAWLYHATMDGASGSFRLVPVVVQQYDLLDRRFTEGHVVPWVIGAVELFVMYPLCLVTLWTVLKRHPLRFPMEIVTSTFHIMGMIVFVVSEVYEGQTKIPALDPVGIPGDRWANLKFTDPYHLVYYWFGFWFCNLIWGFVPYYRITRAVDECRLVFVQHQKSD
jgi:hypothetical protein